jgi:hypothetical protein
VATVPPIGEDEIRELGRRHLPKKAVDELLRLAQPTIVLGTRPARPAQGHECRLGGRPKVAPEFTWPATDGRPLFLLVVLQLATLAPDAPGGMLPKRGYLDLFYDVAGPQLVTGASPPERFRVQHVDVDLYEERPTPAGAEQYPAVAVEPVVQLSLPHPREPEVAELAERYGPKLRRFHDEYIEAAGVPRHRMFGWPDLVEGPMAPSLPRLRGAVGATWQLLVQVDSDDELDWSWGNVGRLYVWVPERDLRKARFDRCQLVLQTY